MEILIIFDSNFGNTKRIADHMAAHLAKNAASVSVNDFKESDLQGIKVLVIGSPINGWKPTKRITAFLSHLNPISLKDVKGGAFDTRIKSFLSGNAAKKIAKALENSGVNIIAPSIGFYVKRNEGPLVEGELKKAENWIQLIKSKIG